MVGEDDGSVALGNASHCHVEDTMRGLDVMLLQAQDHKEIRKSAALIWQSHRCEGSWLSRSSSSKGGNCKRLLRFCNTLGAKINAARDLKGLPGVTTNSKEFSCLMFRWKDHNFFFFLPQLFRNRLQFFLTRLS